MDKAQLCRSLEQVTKSLTPSVVEIVWMDDEFTKLRVISEKFGSLNLVERSNLMSQLIEDFGENLAGNISFIFELMTKADFELLYGDSEADDQAESRNPKSGIAAQSNL